MTSLISDILQVAKTWANNCASSAFVFYLEWELSWIHVLYSYINWEATQLTELALRVFDFRLSLANFTQPNRARSSNNN